MYYHIEISGRVEYLEISTFPTVSNCVSRLKEVELDFSDNNLQYITEKMPTGFLNDRTPKKPEEYVLEVKGNTIKVNLKNETICYSVSYAENGSKTTENILSL